MTRLAIDLGTSHTVAVVERPGQQPRSVLFDGSPLLPSGVFAADGGGIHVGRDAERLSQLEPHRYEPHPKRRVDEGTVLLGDAGYPVATLLAAVLHRVLQEAGSAGLFGHTTTVITCPADWGRVRRSVLLDAAHQAGIADPVLVDEPVAAAAYCTRVLGGHVPAGQSLLVFDFGGGTLDLALVHLGGAAAPAAPGQLSPAGTRVTGVSGLENLGGLDVDEALVGHLGQIVASRDPATWQRLSRPNGPAELRERRAFRAEVRVAKEMLSRTTVAPVTVPGWAETLHLTREELDRLAGPLIDRAVDETRRLLDRAGVPIGAILLVGGSSRIPLVATRLHTRFGIAPMVPEQPELPVALGALASLDLDLEPAQGPAQAHGQAPGAAPGPGRPVSGMPGTPVSGLPGMPVSGMSGIPGAPVSGMPTGPTSGSATGADTSTGIPVGASPVSGAPGAAWTGRPQGPWDNAPDGPGTPDGAAFQPGAGPWPANPAGRGRSRRNHSQGGFGPRAIIAIAASFALVVLAGATIWFVRDAVGDRDQPETPGAQPNSSATAGGPGGSSPTPSVSRGPTPADFAWCGDAIFCPTKPYCEDADEDEIECTKPHTTEVFAGGLLPADAAIGGNEAVAQRADVKLACSQGTLNTRSLDRSKTDNWNRYSQWQQRNGANMFLCFTGPKQGTATGTVIKQAPPQ